ncbi:MAG TPA: SIMPL domain-containing protein [Bacteroidales bacterium]|nr:SIMPL domain-containing protein [Bacteroidales bacterium]
MRRKFTIISTLYIMKNTLIILATLFSLTLFAQNGEKNFIDLNYIEVTGKAELEVVPDQIFLKIILNEKEFKSKQSIKEMEQLMTDKLSEIGIDAGKDLVVKDFVSNFQFYRLSKTDINVSKEYQLLVHDASTAGKVFVELEKAGISNITVEKLDHTKMQEYRKAVKVDAIKAAKEKASDLAAAIGQGIGRAVYINEVDMNNTYHLNTIIGRVAGMSAQGSRSGHSTAQEDLNLEFEKISIEYTIFSKSSMC